MFAFRPKSLFKLGDGAPAEVASVQPAVFTEYV